MDCPKTRLAARRHQIQGLVSSLRPNKKQEGSFGIGHQSLFLIEITPQNHSQWWSENHWWLDKVQHCGILGTPSWFARSCKNAAGKLSRGGKQQQGPISPNHVQAIKGPSVWITVANHATLDARLNQNAWSRLDSAYCLKSRRQERYPTNRPFQRMGSTKSAF